jgi:hypothetical protein
MLASSRSVVLSATTIIIVLPEERREAERYIPSS